MNIVNTSNEEMQLTEFSQRWWHKLLTVICSCCFYLLFGSYMRYTIPATGISITAVSISQFTNHT